MNVVTATSLSWYWIGGPSWSYTTRTSIRPIVNFYITCGGTWIGSFFMECCRRVASHAGKVLGQIVLAVMQCKRVG